MNPGEDAVWDAMATAVHGLTKTDERIVNASDITTVWDQFNTWIERNTPADETIVLVAWNGQACDLKWLWRITQAPRSNLNLSMKIKHFIDPYQVIRNYKGGGLHPSKSKVESLELGIV